MGNSTYVPVYGWVGAGNDRGTGDILWSCGMTVVLCCWVSVYPNVGSPRDKWYHPFIDKFNVFCIALLGPDFLFGIAFGQFSSARRSVKLFKDNPPLQHKIKWTYTHAFFVDAGGIHLTSPDFPGGFPIDAQQLHYLITHNFVEPPDLDKMDISERNSADILSRVITILQAGWFFVGIIQRVCERLPMTTLELTTFSFALLMFATSATWYFKPSIAQPRAISTKDSKTIQTIREFSQLHTHPMLPGQWYRTPLEYISPGHFGINIHWRYYTRLAQMLHIPIFSRPVTSRPWDRFPSDTWLCPSFTYTPIVAFLTVGFSLLFLAAWNFHFPTHAEMILWRICSVYHAVFSIYGCLYYLVEMLKSRKMPSHPSHSRQHLQSFDDVSSTHQRSRNLWHDIMGFLARFLRKWRNTMPEQDPELEISLRVLIPVTIMCLLYAMCRLYIYVEDFASLRTQPFGVYISTDIFFWSFGS